MAEVEVPPLAAKEDRAFEAENLPAVEAEKLAAVAQAIIPEAAPREEEEGEEDSKAATGTELGKASAIAVPVGKKKKKNLKDAMARADAAGPDMYDAYRAPQEVAKEIELSTDTLDKEDKGDKGAKGPKKETPPKVEAVDDWEDNVDLLSTKSEEKKVLGRKGQYSRDYLLGLREAGGQLTPDMRSCKDLMELVNTADVPDMRSMGPGSRSIAGVGRASQNDRKGSFRSADSSEETWARGAQLSTGAAGLRPSTGPGDVRLDNAMAGPIGAASFRPGSLGPGGRPGFPSPLNLGFGPGHVPPMGRPGIVAPPPAPPVRTNGIEADRWTKNPLPKAPAPPPRVALPSMHKAENRYQVGTVSDEEEKKQRQIKGILNKLTPQNFEKLFGQVSLLDWAGHCRSCFTY